MKSFLYLVKEKQSILDQIMEKCTLVYYREDCTDYTKNQGNFRYKSYTSPVELSLTASLGVVQ